MPNTPVNKGAQPDSPCPKPSGPMQSCTNTHRLSPAEMPMPTRTLSLNPSQPPVLLREVVATSVSAMHTMDSRQSVLVHRGDMRGNLGKCVREPLLLWSDVSRLVHPDDLGISGGNGEVVDSVIWPAFHRVTDAGDDGAVRPGNARYKEAGSPLAMSHGLHGHHVPTAPALVWSPGRMVDLLGDRRLRD